MQLPGSNAIVSVVIPCLDEEEPIAGVVREVLEQGVDEVIVVDNGSRDATAARARDAGARVVAEPARGYGRACAAGVAAVRGDADIVCFLDGDGSDVPALPRRCGRARSRAARRISSWARASRGRREPGSMTPQQLVAGRLAGVLMRLVYGVRFTDMSPFRAIRVERLRRLGMSETTYGWNLEMQMRAAAAGLRIREVPVDHRCRRGGVSKVSGNLARGTRRGMEDLGHVPAAGLRAAPRAAPRCDRRARDSLRSLAMQKNQDTVLLHPLVVRLTHWAWALGVLVLIGSGLRIYESDPVFEFVAFPVWITLGGSYEDTNKLHNDFGLAAALLWHFAAMWLLFASLPVFLVCGPGSPAISAAGTFPSPRARSLATSRTSCRGRLPHDIGMRNAVQKLLYAFALADMVVMVLSGLVLWKPVQFQTLSLLMGQYEGARYVHFFGMAGIVVFVIVHVALTLLVPKVLPPMITGRAPRTADPAASPGDAS